MKCKPYSEITVEIRTQLKIVKITSNIFAVYFRRSVLAFTLLKMYIPKKQHEKRWENKSFGSDTQI